MKTASEYVRPYPKIILPLTLLVVVLCGLFWRAFTPGIVHFSNDGPLGVQMADWVRSPSGLAGAWNDLNSIGINAAAFPPSISTALRFVVGPVGYAKFYAPVALLLVGLGAWFFFNRLGLDRSACLLGALAAALNGTFFSTACWGVASQVITFSMNFVALGLVVSNKPDTPVALRYTRLILAGLAVGMGVLEGFDIGAIFSLFTAAFVLFAAFNGQGTLIKRITNGLANIALIALFAGFIASQTIVALVATQIKGVARAASGTRAGTKQFDWAAWDWATQWSLPKTETLGLLVPGLFGYRMDTPGGGEYWGAVGRDPAWDRYFAGGPLVPRTLLAVSFPGNTNLDTTVAVDPDGKISLPLIGEVNVLGKNIAQVKAELEELYGAKLPGQQVNIELVQPVGFLRYTGGGNYLGAVVWLVALWAIAQALRGGASVFTPLNRRQIVFWTVVSVIALLLAYGRHAPFYRFFYMLPYMSAIRNPTKFLHVFTWAMIVVFAYGVHGLSRCYLQTIAGNLAGAAHGWRIKSWWATRKGFERTWSTGLIVVVAASTVALLIYNSMQPELVGYLKEMFRPGTQIDENYMRSLQEMAAFSVRQAALFVLFLAAGAAVMILTFSGAFAGKRARLGTVLLGLVLVCDLARANHYWTVFWDYKYKYASNPVIDVLRDKPYEHRVAILPLPLPPQIALFEQLYRIEWAQHHFQYYNIQSLDIVQMPRVPGDLAAFESALAHRGVQDTLHLVARRWQLTNTRYLLGAAMYLDALNDRLDPEQRRFNFAMRFDLALKPGIEYFSKLEDVTVVPASQGALALFEFKGALPRARLYSTWQVTTNDDAALKIIADKEFDPWQTVLVCTPLPAGVPETATNQNTGTVEFQSYSPKQLVLKTDARDPAILLLNDKFDPGWQVFVDGKPAQLLRCNFIMRGVYVPPGTHTVEFRFEPHAKPLYVSLAAIALGIVLTCMLMRLERTKSAEATQPTPQPSTAPEQTRKSGKQVTKNNVDTA